MTGVVSEMLGEYIRKRKAQLIRSGKSTKVQAMMKMSESSFAEWDNREDDIYDRI